MMEINMCVLNRFNTFKLKEGLRKRLFNNDKVNFEVLSIIK